MEIFEAQVKKEGEGKLTIAELPFNAREVFSKPKGTIYVAGTIDGFAYRSRLISRGGGRYIMTLDKAMQKSIGFDGEAMTVRITMTPEEVNVRQARELPLTGVTCEMDVITAIKTRQSIRKFTTEPVGEEKLNMILSAGLCAPSAKNKRPCHFIVIGDRQILSDLARNHSNASMLESAAYGIVICGDKNTEGMKEFLYADCAAAAQNMLLSIHGLGLGGVWCGVAANSDWRKRLTDKLELPQKLEPVAVIALGCPDETKKICPRWDREKIHFDRW